MKFVGLIILFHFSFFSQAAVIFCTTQISCQDASDPFDICQVATLAFEFGGRVKQHHSARFAAYSFMRKDSYPYLESVLIPSNLSPGYPRFLKLETKSLRWLVEGRPEHGLVGGVILRERVIDNPRYYDFFGKAGFHGFKGVLLLGNSSFKWKLSCRVIR